MFGTYHLIALGLFAGFAAVDLLARARAFPEVPMWKLKGIAFTLLYFAVATYAPLMWDGLLGQYQLVDGSALWCIWWNQRHSGCTLCIVRCQA